MAAKQLNPGSSFDPWLAVPFFLAASGPLGRLVRPLLPASWGPGAGGKGAFGPWLSSFFGPLHSSRPDEAGMGLGLALAVVLLVVLFRLRAHAGTNRTCRVLAGAFMALAGGLVIYFLSGVLLAFPGTLALSYVLPHWALSGAALLLVCSAGFLACYWAGWRYGAWGPFWGACAALLCLSVLARELAADPATEFRARDLAFAGGAVLVGALAGALGAAHFQRGLAAEAAAATSPPNHGGSVGDPAQAR